MPKVCDADKWKINYLVVNFLEAYILNVVIPSKSAFILLMLRYIVNQPFSEKIIYH